MPYPSFLRSLASRNYRLFFAGQGVSLIGNWMTTTASAWLAYELSGSAFVVGLVPFANQIPVLLLSPLAGLLGDRCNRQRLLIGLQCLCAVQSVALATVTLLGQVSVGWLLALAAVRGMINAVEYPTRQAFVVELVTHKADLPNAIALNSSMFNLARLIGPSLAGLLIVAKGPGLCYALDALSFIGIIAGLCAMRLTPRPPRVRAVRPLDDLKAGWRYAWRAPTLRAPIVMVAMIALVGFGASILAPVFARDVFHRDARTLGTMYAAVAVGALVSGLFLSARTSAEGLPRWVARGALLVAAAQFGFALTTSLPVALACLAASGTGVVLVMAPCNTLVQQRVDDDKRSRVMGLFTMGQGMFPLGSVLIGALADGVGARGAVGVCAGICAVGAATLGRAVRAPARSEATAERLGASA